jgi:hypothetical protein
MESNIKIDLQKVEREGTDWVDLSQDREKQPDLVNTVMNFRLP